MNHYLLEKELNQLLNVDLFSDYCPNGLQIEGNNEIKTVVTGVTACQALLDKAIELRADAIVVHHGYFWKNETYPIVGIKYKRISSLIKHNINLFAYHLPLDAHHVLGNNVQLAKLLDINVIPKNNPTDLLQIGQFKKTLNNIELKQLIESKLMRKVITSDIDGEIKSINKVAWCTGGGQDYIQQAIDEHTDAFITGEVSEKTIHIARENNISFYAAGHHATERYGIMALSNFIKEQLKLDVHFIDIDNPA